MIQPELERIAEVLERTQKIYEMEPTGLMTIAKRDWATLYTCGKIVATLHDEDKGEDNGTDH